MKYRPQTVQAALSVMIVITAGVWFHGHILAEDSGASKQAAVFEKLRLLAYDERVEVPDFTLPEIQGNTLTLSDLQGQAVFLNFWTTW